MSNLKIGDTVRLIVRPKGTRRAVMYDGFLAHVVELRADEALVDSSAINVLQAVSFRTWWPLADLEAVEP